MSAPESQPEASLELSPLALSILELLHERPMHPYELAATMRARHHDEFIRLNFGSLYHTVEMLERNGWIVPVEREKEGRRPERTVYRLADSGHDVLIRVVSEALAHPRKEYPQFAAGLMFMHHLDAKSATGLLQERSGALTKWIEKMSRILSDLHDSGHTRLTVIELEHKIAMLQAERTWINKIANEIAEKKLEWKVGVAADHETLRRKHGTGSH